MTKDAYIALMKGCTTKLIKVSQENCELRGLYARVLWLNQGIVECAREDMTITHEDFLSIINMHRHLVHVTDKWLDGELNYEEEF